MQVIKPFFLGTLGGLACSFALLLGLYFSPIREFVYFQADPEIADLRSKLSQYREWLAQADLYIVEKGPETSDSLQTAQTLAWREYKKWRNHLGELARLHDKPTAEGIVTWTYSLRYWAIPSTLFLTLIPAIWLAWRARNRFRPSRSIPRSTRRGGSRIGFGEGNSPAQVKSEALSSFQDTLKKIAQISDAGKPPTGSATEVDGSYLPPTAPLPILTEDEREPETKPLPVPLPMPLFSDFSGTGSSGTLPPKDSVWSELRHPEASALTELSMEDEEVENEAGEGEAKGFLHPTTELERVERRKDEVLKLARKGMTSSEISRRMRISQDQVEFIIRLRREKG